MSNDADKGTDANESAETKKNESEFSAMQQEEL